MGKHQTADRGTRGVAQALIDRSVNQARRYAGFFAGDWNDARRVLPDDDIDVLCCNAAGEQMWVGHHSAGAWIKSDSAGDIEMTHLVSHWMELPETPQ